MDQSIGQGRGLEGRIELLVGISQHVQKEEWKFICLYGRPFISGTRIYYFITYNYFYDYDFDPRQF